MQLKSFSQFCKREEVTIEKTTYIKHYLALYVYNMSIADPIFMWLSSLCNVCYLVKL